MKIAVYSSRTRAFDGQIFAVRTVNRHEIALSTQVTPDCCESWTVGRNRSCTAQVYVHDSSARVNLVK
jgi:hypothetical protein